MKKYIFLSIALLATGLIGLKLLINPRQPKQSETKQDSSVYREDSSQSPKRSETIFIRYGENGFSPQRVAITRGTTVSFINESAMPLWVASDPHPEHTDYPEFDTARVNDGRKPQMGENFDFTFEKAGTWNYHSHNASSDTDSEENHPGTIVVN